MKGHALIQSGKWEGHDFFRKKFLKYPGPTPQLKTYLPLVWSADLLLSATWLPDVPPEIKCLDSSLSSLVHVREVMEHHQF